MKTKLYSLLIISIIFLASCGKWIDTGLNTDPTLPNDATLNVLLPTLQAGTAYVLGGDIDRFTALFTQHITGTSRQHLGLYRYQVTESDINNAWVTMYSGPMMDMYVMINKARENGSPHYLGIAEVMMAYSLGFWTDILGDIPYSECFQGDKNLRPKYDTQSEIYTSIQKLLDSAIVHLGASSSNFSPAEDDFIYSGDLALWTKAAYTLKARFYLHVKEFNLALTALTNGISSNAEDMRFTFGSAETEANPWYQFVTQRGDISMGEPLMTVMNNLNDPRRPAYAELDDSSKYSPNSPLGAYYSSINSPVEFVTYAEAKFIESECRFYNNDKPGAYTAYTDAITSSIQKYIPNADVAGYLAQAAVGVGDANLTVQNIMDQKYIAMYTQYESWVDWRRTGFPSLNPTTGTQIIRRFPYPQSERLFNFGSLSAVQGYSQATSFMFTKVWWDKMWNP
ncbi:MAG: SusD/RagB family nutrient-binding outer membrane lipoprotein [Bacteroidetes bacterium]|nr:MAG: SusD/RagB family nutrient-binding outer membrane lipoprotein [Bacteroidota bacterium]